MLFKAKKFERQFDPDGGSGGGGEGDGDGDMEVLIVTAIPKLKESDFILSGKQAVLLVKIIDKKSKCNCEKMPLKVATELIPKVILESQEKVEASLKSSEETNSRKSLKTGPVEYLQALQEILSELFCKKEIEFSCEKIG